MSELGLDPDGLSEAFPQAGEDQWRGLVDKALKGADYDRTLVTRTRDGFNIAPLYPQTEISPARPARVEAGPWTLAQRMDLADAKAAAEQGLADLEGGADGLVLVGEGGLGARGFGAGTDDLATRLKDINLDMIRLRLDAGMQTVQLAQALANELADRDLGGAVANVDAGHDPVALHAATGAGAPTLESLGKDLAALAVHGFGGTVITADARVIHDAGGTPAQELAFALAVLVENLRAAETAKLSVPDMAGRVLAIMSADADIFLTIAKLRAMRILWARVKESSGLPPVALRLEAETAWRMMSRRDPYVNLLRATAAVTAAGLGGADGITVLPHTLAIGLPDRFARRVARNIQNVLIGESNLYRVADPAGGSGYVETLTLDLAKAAWAQFQEIEGEGGIIASLASGRFAGEVAEARAALEKDIARRKLPLTGVSEFPNLNETQPDVLKPAPKAENAGALPAMRMSQPFEALRDCADAAASRPTAFLANIGTVPQFNPRAMFTANALASGGIAAEGGEGGTDVSAIADAAKTSGTKLAVICSTDALYAEHAADLARALKGAGVGEVWLAGRPGDMEAALSEAGVTRYLFAGCDILDALEAAHTAVSR
ncbi:methylmalonyl-CoA mutase family protein [Tepidamorphus sp. 3E244]|uniref:methylmalonyl-CoA mutase family protein n=1 Tax=Tepidamorphus sp. 3E244 TaxID=3385498 RepID=UPI0038FCF2A9